MCDPDNDMIRAESSGEIILLQKSMIYDKILIIKMFLFENFSPY